ncbi:hypothetical protein [Georgfuchsia toluolica]|uniref:hypothetical protein n=1 Tax=Georgfuchsia toluolica TaxID=424218 RepID=UPI001FE2EC67|nr:hypothetical protein [Georgfuchsia toluolica]
MNRRLSQLVLALFALGFGLLTIISGGHVLFGDEAARRSVGHYVPFVLWFNFIAGFAYVSAGFGILRSHPWAAKLALGIAVTTFLVFVSLGIHIAMGGAFEVRTIVAMTFRTLTWCAIYIVLSRFLIQSRKLTQ